MSGDSIDSVPTTKSGFSVSFKQCNFLTLFTIDLRLMLMIFNLFGTFHSNFFIGVEVLDGR